MLYIIHEKTDRDIRRGDINVHVIHTHIYVVYDICLCACIPFSQYHSQSLFQLTAGNMHFLLFNALSLQGQAPK